MAPPTLSELESGLEKICRSPADNGPIELIVRRPERDAREFLDVAELSVEAGLLGDMWPTRTSRSSADGRPDPAKQVTVMNARLAALVAGEPKRWALAGDQIYADLDLSVTNLPAGTRLRLGSAELEVTDAPHPGCAKFRERFGADALRFVNSPRGRELRLRGVNTTVITGGTVSKGDIISRAT